MFAPKVAKPQAKGGSRAANSLAPQRTAPVAYRPDHSALGQALMLQRMIGNQGTLRLLVQPNGRHPGQSLTIPATTQPTPAVGRIDDPLEQEANRVADQVMHIQVPGVTMVAAQPQFSPQCGDCEEEEEPVRPQSTADEAPRIVHEVLRSSGQRLDAATRAHFEPRFGRDLGRVRVHTDALAAKSAYRINARAYAVEHHVVLGAPRPAPDSPEGRRLLGHELAHVAQHHAGAPVVVRRSPAGTGMYPPHARAHAGEQGMGFGYRREAGWIFVEGPSGAAGHGVTEPGFDGVTYNLQGDQAHILDNKSLKNTTAYSASALTRNVLKNLDALIVKVTNIKDMPSRIRILQLLRRARGAIAAETVLPKNVKLVITGVGGQVGKISGPLRRQGVVFQEPGTLDVPLAPLRPPARQVGGVIETLADPIPLEQTPSKGGGLNAPAKTTPSAEIPPVRETPPSPSKVPTAPRVEVPRGLVRAAGAASVGFNALGILGTLKMGHDLQKLSDFHDTIVSGEFFNKFWSEIGAYPDGARITVGGSQGTLDLSKGIVIRFDEGGSIRLISSPAGGLGMQITDRDGSGGRVDETGVHEFPPSA
jgi:hypothetical protein